MPTEADTELAALTGENPSKRQQLAALMEEVNADQSTAIAETLAYLNSPEIAAFRDKIGGFQQRTLPGSHFDQIFGSMLKMLDSTKEMANLIVNPPAQS